jgi:succinate dehydrogenase / fumarate reductase, cytochrome b subunit
MSVNRNVGLKGLGYKGGGPMWSWALHRISGLGLILFVGLHVLASFFTHVVPSGGDIAMNINGIYESWAFQIMIYFFAIFHGLNGLRIAICDFWPALLQYQRELIWLQWLTFIPLYGMALYFIITGAMAAGG